MDLRLWKRHCTRRLLRCICRRQNISKSSRSPRHSWTYQLHPFYKGLLDKIGVEMQIIRVGTYKSAVEPFMLTQMSEANKQQTSAFIGSIWKT